MRVTHESMRMWFTAAHRARHPKEHGSALWGTYATFGRLYNRALIRMGRKPHVEE